MYPTEDFALLCSYSKKCKQRKGALLYSADRLVCVGAAPLALLARARIKKPKTKKNRVQHISPLKATPRQEQAAAPGEALVEDLQSPRFISEDEARKLRSFTNAKGSYWTPEPFRQIQ